jgi:hypothetical protein
MQDVSANQSQSIVQQLLPIGDLQPRKLYVGLHPPLVDRLGQEAGGTQQEQTRYPWAHGT